MKLTAALAVSISFVCGAGPAFAGKVTMPMEGVYELKFCTVGSGSIIVANDKAYASHYSGVAVLNAQPVRGAFDGQSVRCRLTWSDLGMFLTEQQLLRNLTGVLSLEGLFPRRNRTDGSRVCL